MNFLQKRDCAIALLLLAPLWTVIVAYPWSSVNYHGKPVATMMRPLQLPGNGRFALNSQNEYNIVSFNSVTGLMDVRGGEIALPSDDQDDESSENALMSSVRSAIRGLLKFGDDTLPPLSGLLRSCFHVVEKLTGIRLLPSKIKKRTSSSKKSKKKSKTEASSGLIDDESGSSTKKKEEKKSTAGKKVSTKPSDTTQKHVSSSLKSNNPNYRIQKELKKFIQDPPPNLSVQVGSNIRLWVVTMVGANNTIYEGEVFKLRISFPKDYPTVPPSVYFLKGYIPKHEHVYTNGDICLSLLGKDWRPTMTAQSIANSILSILSSAQHKALPMDNAAHANAKPGEYQKDWVYHDDRC